MSEKRKTLDIIEINGERYKRVKSINLKEIILSIFVKYLEEFDIKKATPEEIRILTDVALELIGSGIY